MDNIRIRPATPADSAFLLEVVNDPTVIFWSGRRREIAPMDHIAWYQRALSDPTRYYIVVAEDEEGRKVGYGRVEYVTEARVSFAVVEEARGAGVGQALLQELEWNERGGRLVAYVHPGNGASLGAFKARGWWLDEMRTERGTAWQILRK